MHAIGKDGPVGGGGGGGTSVVHNKELGRSLGMRLYGCWLQLFVVKLLYGLYGCQLVIGSVFVAACTCMSSQQLVCHLMCVCSGVCVYV